jgi:hypothetical protein
VRYYCIQSLLTIQEALQEPNNVGSIRLRFEEQKNIENGEKKLFVHHNKNPAICFVQNFMEILLCQLRSRAHAKLPDARAIHSSACAVPNISFLNKIYEPSFWILSVLR